MTNKFERLIKIRRYILMSLFCMTLVSCSGNKEVKDSARDSAPESREVKIDIDKVPNAVPRAEPKSKYGNPKSYVVFEKRYYVLDNSKDFVQKGIASWYGKKFHGRRTSSGETYDMYAMTAAHKSLPLPTYVEVTNLKNKRSIIVKVNDRGPFHQNRIIDLSYTAARKLDIVANGTGLVKIRAIDPGNYKKHSKNKKETVTKGPGAPVRTALTSGAQGFFIQVGAFGNEINAERMRNRIAGLGENIVNVRSATINGKLLYRVQIGPLYDVDKADSIVDQLADFNINEHRIVLE
ncbi:MAG: septal ring lytic transglycosylase RlpA family protein [Gammaproteobacteria bacterium]|nr:septal ring lytic transglycosylase RlpA family protein [Gammaproteobacteria bacterium]